jgi:hypothetical protein
MPQISLFALKNFVGLYYLKKGKVPTQYNKISKALPTELQQQVDRKDRIVAAKLKIC